MPLTKLPDCPTSLKKLGLVLTTGPAGSWDAGMVESPVVWFDERTNRYAMVYTGYASTDPERHGYSTVTRPQVGLAWSDDLVNWEKDPANPIFGPTGDAQAGLDSHGTAGPCIFVWDGLYHLFYFSTSAAGYEKGTKALHHATSSDLYNWQRDPANPVIAPHGAGWRSIAIWHPHVVRQREWFWLFFNVSGMISLPYDNAMAAANTLFEEETIGVARSRDLSTWEVLDEISPLIIGSGKPGAWDSTGRTGDPSLWRVGDRWYMAYYSWDGVNTRDGIASTTDSAFPNGWRPIPENPVLDIGAPDSFDAMHAGKPFVLRTDSHHYHFYTAVAADEARNIAVAIAPIT